MSTNATDLPLSEQPDAALERLCQHCGFPALAAPPDTDHDRLTAAERSRADELLAKARGKAVSP